MTDLEKTRKHKSYARKYRDLFAECPTEKDKIIRILGEMVLEARVCERWSRLCTISVAFCDGSCLRLSFNDDKSLSGQFLDERDYNKNWDYIG